MKLLWLCNMVPGAVQEKINGKQGGGLWVDSVLEGLRNRKDCVIRVLCLSSVETEGALDDTCSYATFTEGLPYVYMPELEERFRKELETFCPDVIHIWGTEFGHTLAMVNACEKLGFLDRTAVSIQGLCSVIARHYAEGVPYPDQRRITFRDLVRRDNILQQQTKFALRGELEVQALKKVRHIMGRTHWDEACTSQINPDAQYHFCNETLRQTFYEGQWRYEDCQKHRIFASSCFYPVKGFHYLLEAFAEVLKTFPDATLAVPGTSFLDRSPEALLRKSSYQRYLTKLVKTYGLEDRIEFLGDLSADQMKAAYLSSNVFVLPSTIENSPNSLGEAMLLGVPCAASDVGGVTTMLVHEQEGYVYQPSAPYVLAYFIKKIFAMEADAQSLGAAAKRHAEATHNAQTNLDALLAIYKTLEGR